MIQFNLLGPFCFGQRGFRPLCLICPSLLERESKRLGRKMTQREFVLGLIEEALSKAEAASEGVNEETEDITEGEAEPEPDQAERGGEEEADQAE